MSQGSPSSEVEQSELNPYRSPGAPSPATELSHPVDEDGGRLDGIDLTRIGRAIRIGLFAMVVPSAVSILIIIGLFAMQSGRVGNGPAAVFRNWILGAAALVAIVSLLAFVVGVINLCRVRGRHRMTGWLGVILFLAGATGTAGVLVRLINGGVLLGLAPLFAASVYSTLLTSIALMTMSYRYWSIRIGSTRSARAFEFGVVMLALSGASVSLAVLNPAVFRSGMVGPIVAWLAFAVAVVAILILYGLNRLRNDWTLAKRIPIT